MIRATDMGHGWGVSPAVQERRRRALVAMAVGALALPMAAAATAVVQGTVQLASVIVRTSPSSTTGVEHSVRSMGGTVDRQLGVISGFSATVPTNRLADLNATPGVLEVSGNAHVQMFSIGGYDPTTDVNSLYNITQMTGAQAYWQQGYTGKGVTVALIDTGVAPVNGLTAPGKVILGPDISFDSQVPQLQENDGYGHGTHMAGIIAGRDNAASPGSYAGDTNDFVGMAPDASILSVKVGDHTGAADVSQVIAAIDWVVQHRNDNGMNVRVLNLSFGTDSPQSYTLDPLAYAAEQAWLDGIVVVASAGNAGSAASSLSDPADDPYLIAAGAADTNGSTNAQNDTVASFSSSGNGVRNPDLVAPGVHVASLADPGSYLDTLYGSTADVGTRFFRGSGTSQAAAVISGAAALILSQRPWYSPDQVKAVLDSSATPLSGATPQSEGHGQVNLSRALTTYVSQAKQHFATSSGTGSLQAARGSLTLTANGVTLSGEQDIFGKPFNSTTMAGAEANQSSWSGGTWNGSGWSGSGWSGSGWSGSGWSGSGWSGSAWSGSAWSGSAWSGSGWSGSGWSGSGWSGSGWSGSGWSGSGWSGSGWSGSAWSGSGWSGSGWSGTTWS